MELKYRFDHYNFNVFDLEKILEFYKKALGLVELRRKTADDGSFILAFLGDGQTGFQLELTWLRDWDRPYAMGDNELHLCLRVSGDYEAARVFHREMGCVCFENEKMGIYFITDPDEHWIELLPEK
jgi:lactoylglutathione lyase